MNKEVDINRILEGFEYELLPKPENFGSLDAEYRMKYVDIGNSEPTPTDQSTGQHSETGSQQSTPGCDL